MSRQRSPNYPNTSLPDAIARARKAFDLDRQAPLDRETAAKHIGYGGRSGASDKMIGTITQYGLFEAAGKGEVRVSQLAMDIFHPLNEQQKRESIFRAAYSPKAFQSFRDRFGAAVIPSEDAAKSYLVREGFMDRAVGPLYAAYVSTCQFLKQEGATDFSVPSDETVEESDETDVESEAAPVKVVASGTISRRAHAPLRNTETHGMQRMLTQGMLSKGSTFEIIVTGQIGPKEIDTLIRKLQIDKEILADSNDDDDGPTEAVDRD